MLVLSIQLLSCDFHPLIPRWLAIVLKFPACLVASWRLGVRWEEFAHMVKTIVPGLSPLTFCLILPIWWLRLPSRTEGPASPSRFVPAKFECLGRTISGIFLRHGGTAFHICV